MTLQLLTAADAAKQLQMLRARVLRMARAGEIPHVALPDGEIRFDPADLAKWVESHKQSHLTHEVGDGK